VGTSVAFQNWTPVFFGQGAHSANVHVVAKCINEYKAVMYAFLVELCNGYHIGIQAVNIVSMKDKGSNGRCPVKSDA